MRCTKRRSNHGSLVILGFLTLTFSLRAQWSGSDDFSDVSSDAQWLPDITVGHASLIRTNQHLEYRVASPDLVNGDEAYHPWSLIQPPNSVDWEVVVEVGNSATATAVGQVASFGIQILNANNWGDYVFVELYSSMLGHPSLRRGFKADLAVNGIECNRNSVVGDSGGHWGLIRGSVRMVFHSGAKTFTAFYDRGSINGYQWEKLVTFGIQKENGSTTNANWNMASDATFYVALYGFSQGMVINPGEMFGDNFHLQSAMTDRRGLGIRREAQRVQLYWPAAMLGYELEANGTLKANLWTNVIEPPISLHGTNFLDVPVDGSTRFFRLRRP